MSQAADFCTRGIYLKVYQFTKDMWRRGKSSLRILAKNPAVKVMSLGMLRALERNYKSPRNSEDSASGSRTA